jgi:hypothetical protein
MSPDSRSEAAKFYDLNPHCPDDLPFYASRVLHNRFSILELGCGTGRITVPLSKRCEFIQGIDIPRVPLRLPACGVDGDRGATARFGASLGPAHGSHLSASSSSAEKPIAAIGFEP